MKKKLIIVVTLVAVLALGGTLVFAAVDEDGNWVNPLANILSGRVEDGTITQEEADTFSKVWEAIKGDMKDSGRKRIAGKNCRPDGMEGYLEINPGFMEEYRAVLKEKTDEIKNSLIEEGILDADDKNLKGMDEETLESVKEAMSAVKDYMNEFVDGKVADGTITQEQADIFLKMDKRRVAMPGSYAKCRGPENKFPGGFRNKDDEPGE